LGIGALYDEKNGDSMGVDSISMEKGKGMAGKERFYYSVGIFQEFFLCVWILKKVFKTLQF